MSNPRRVGIRAILQGVLSLRFKHVGYMAFVALIGTIGLGLSGLVTGIAIWKAHQVITWWMAGTPSDSCLEILKVCVVGIPGAGIVALWAYLDDQKTRKKNDQFTRQAAAEDARAEAKDKAIKSLTLAIWRHRGGGGLTPYVQQEIEHCYYGG